MRFVRCKTTSEYEAMILATPEQAYSSICLTYENRSSTLTLLAAGTGLRISECLGLQWQDVSLLKPSFRCAAHGHAAKWAGRKAKPPKGPVPLHPLRAKLHAALET